MLFICRIHVRRQTLFGGGLMVYFDNELSRRTVDGIPLRCMVIIVWQPSSLKGSSIPRECPDKSKVRIDIRNLQGSLCDIQLLFSDNYYPRWSTKEQQTWAYGRLKLSYSTCTANGVLTSCLNITLGKVFSGTQALPENRGACVDTWLWQDTDCNEDGPGERVFSMKRFTSPSGTTLMFRLYSFDLILRTETILRVA